MLTAIVMAALVAFTPHAAPTSFDAAQSARHTATVVGPVIELGWLESANVPALRCPDHAGLRSQVEYHRGSGWRIPRGVELRTGGPGIDASIMAPLPLGEGVTVRRDGAGGWDSSVTNWTLGDNWVQLVLHCTTH